MVSNSKDDHPSKATPIMNRVPYTIPRTAQHVPRQLLSVGIEKSKQPMAHAGIQSDGVHSWIPLIWLVIVSSLAGILCLTSLQL